MATGGRGDDGRTVTMVSKRKFAAGCQLTIAHYHHSYKQRAAIICVGACLT